MAGHSFCTFSTYSGRVCSLQAAIIYVHCRFLQSGLIQTLACNTNGSLWCYCTIAKCFSQFGLLHPPACSVILYYSITDDCALNTLNDAAAAILERKCGHWSAVWHDQPRKDGFLKLWLRLLWQYSSTSTACLMQIYRRISFWTNQPFQPWKLDGPCCCMKGKGLGKWVPVLWHFGLCSLCTTLPNVVHMKLCSYIGVRLRYIDYWAETHSSSLPSLYHSGNFSHAFRPAWILSGWAAPASDTVFLCPLYSKEYIEHMHY